MPQPFDWLQFVGAGMQGDLPVCAGRLGVATQMSSMGMWSSTTLPNRSEEKDVQSKVYNEEKRIHRLPLRKEDSLMRGFT